MAIKSDIHLRDALSTAGHIHGNTIDLFAEDLTETTDWKQFADSWNDMPVDDYMADRGRYRHRRFAEFRQTENAHDIEELATTTYRQSKDYNHLNGGIDRHYSSIEPRIRRNTAFRSILGRFHALIPQAHESGTWLIQVFQNRIYARTGELGKPTPEGMHRDGVDFVLSLLINRNNVVGGESGTYCGITDRELSQVTLKRPGDYIFLDDRRMKHAVRPITPAVASMPGYRDVLIAMFTAQT